MSTNYCKHTCPAVDQKFDDLAGDISQLLNDADVDPRLIKQVEHIIHDYNESIKEVGTYLLRNALDNCYGDLIASNHRVDELEAEVETLGSEVDNLTCQVSDLENELWRK